MTAPSARCCIWAAVWITGSTGSTRLYRRLVRHRPADVIALRQRLFPGRPGLHTVAASVTDAHLLDGIPGDQAVLVVAEGLTCYLRAADGVVMLRRITEHFPRGEWLSTATAG